jgi:hypothetical protein
VPASTLDLSDQASLSAKNLIYIKSGSCQRHRLQSIAQGYSSTPILQEIVIKTATKARTIWTAGLGIFY